MPGPHEPRGAPPADRHTSAGEPAGPRPRATERGAKSVWQRLLRALRRGDRAFSRHATAIAMAEDGTREMAMEQLEDPPRETEIDSEAAGRSVR